MAANTSQPKPTYRVIADAIVNGRTKGETFTLADNPNIAVLPLIANGFIERVSEEVT